MVATILIMGIVTYAGYMNTPHGAIKPAAYRPLLQLIGRAESNDNYNAYYGNPANSRVVFTDMSIAEVLEWQHAFVRQGSPSSAVGRYQFINTTLESLVQQLGIDKQQKFDPAMQDTLAITLLEQQGTANYARGILSERQLATNLSKVWAALPACTGSNPAASYYSGDGLNVSRVGVDELLSAIRHIEA